ncbi:MAG TPA: cupin domain-containing protein [Caulobacteraceae bacterium]|jgi:hypothetical protein
MIERRVLLAGTLAVPFLGSPAIAGRIDAGAEKGSEDQFRSISSAVANLLPAPDVRTQLAYVYAVAAHVLAGAEAPPAKLFPMGGFARGVEIGPIAREPNFVVIGYRALPGAKVPPHNHPNYSVVTIGTEGMATIRFFESQNAPPMNSPDPFELEETRAVQLRPGDVAIVTPARDNIHMFEAGPQGAQWIDITTSHGPDLGFSYLDLGASELNHLGRMSAKWTKFS